MAKQALPKCERRLGPGGRPGFVTVHAPPRLGPEGRRGQGGGRVVLLRTDDFGGLWRLFTAAFRNLSRVAVPPSCSGVAAASSRAGGWLAGDACSTAARGVASLPSPGTGFVSTGLSAVEGPGLELAVAAGKVGSRMGNAAPGAGAAGPVGAGGAA